MMKLWALKLLHELEDVKPGGVVILRRREDETFERVPAPVGDLFKGPPPGGVLLVARDVPVAEVQRITDAWFEEQRRRDAGAQFSLGRDELPILDPESPAAGPSSFEPDEDPEKTADNEEDWGYRLGEHESTGPGLSDDEDTDHGVPGDLDDPTGDGATGDDTRRDGEGW